VELNPVLMKISCPTEGNCIPIRKAQTKKRVLMVF